MSDVIRKLNELREINPRMYHAINDIFFGYDIERVFLDYDMSIDELKFAVKFANRLYDEDE